MCVLSLICLFASCEEDYDPILIYLDAGYVASDMYSFECNKPINYDNSFYMLRYYFSKGMCRGECGYE